MKSGIERVRELYPGQDDFDGYVKSQRGYKWPLIVRKNPMGVQRVPGVAFTGEDKELRPPMVGPPYTAFFEDLMGIRAGATCLSAGKDLMEGFIRLTGDEFSARSLYRRIPPDARTGPRAGLCHAIVSILTGAGELYPKALLRAGVALANEKNLDRGMIARVLARVA